jgi:hypothetical protein
LCDDFPELEGGILLHGWTGKRPFAALLWQR